MLSSWGRMCVCEQEGCRLLGHASASRCRLLPSEVAVGAEGGTTHTHHTAHSLTQGTVWTAMIMSPDPAGRPPIPAHP